MWEISVLFEVGGALLQVGDVTGANQDVATSESQCDDSWWVDEFLTVKLIFTIINEKWRLFF